MIKVKVPATSANLGPGFDTLGLALNLYNTYYFEETTEGLEITGCHESYCNENNLVYSSFMKTLDIVGYSLKGGLKIHIESQIPLSRGLGSSAACIVGGIKGANILAGSLLSDDKIIEIATSIEGHPDNIAPAVLGGLVTSIMEDGKVFHNKIKVVYGLKFLALIPDFTLSTKEARAVLPKTLDYKDAVFNVSRVSLLISALVNGNFQLIKYGLGDKLHQPYRGELVGGYYEILDKCNELGSLGTYLSGAGPTIMTLVQEGNPDFISNLNEFLMTLENKWNIVELEIDERGARV